MDAWTMIDDVGQAREACRGKTVSDISEVGAPPRVVVTFTDGTFLEVRSPDLMILEVGYADNTR